MTLQRAAYRGWTVDAIVDRYWPDYRNDDALGRACFERYGDPDEPYVLTEDDFRRYVRDVLIDGDPETADDAETVRRRSNLQAAGPVCDTCLDEHGLTDGDLLADERRIGDAAGGPYGATDTAQHDASFSTADTQLLQHPKAAVDQVNSVSLYCPRHEDDGVFLDFHEFVFDREEPSPYRSRKP